MPRAETNLPRTALRLGTRSSALARWQADWVSARLAASGVSVELVFIQTTGDVTSGPIPSTGSQGLFTKELQRALLDQRIDLAVHSLKDLPTDPVQGLVLAVVPPRESPRDVLVSNTVTSIDELPQAARVGTGSRRRRSQLLYRRRDLQVSDIRGNLDTRLRKLDEGQYDAIVLAEAGLKRLGWHDRITQLIPLELMLPAAGQGALGLEIRADDVETRAAVQVLDDPATHAAVLAERSLLAELRGGCLAPIGMWGRVDGGALRLDGAVLAADGERRIAAAAQGSTENPLALGIQVARDLLGQGAAELIADARV